MSLDPVLVDVPERLDGERTVLLAPRAGLGAEMAVVITQSLSHLRPWMPWAQEAPRPKAPRWSCVACRPTSSPDAT